MSNTRRHTCWHSSFVVLLCVTLCVTFLLVPAPAFAQQDDEPIYDQLAEMFKRDYLSIGVLLQAVADFQIDRTFPGNNGFNISNFRLSLSGELDQRFGYFLQTNFAGTPSILDARMYYRFTPQVAVDVGQFKAPFSYEFLTSAASIDFVNRSQVVTALAPGRQIGIQLRTNNSARTVGFNIGAFNGNGTRPNGNDSNNLLYAARLYGSRAVASSDGTETKIDLGVNVAFSDDELSSFGSGFATGFAGDRAILGADARLTLDRYLISGEVIYASLDPDVGLDRDAWGAHATAGYMFTDKVQGLIRWDGFDPDDGVGRRDWIILGLNAWPTTVTEFQINYIIDTDNAEPDHHQLLVNFQFGF